MSARLKVKMRVGIKKKAAETKKEGT